MNSKFIISNMFEDNIKTTSDLLLRNFYKQSFFRSSLKLPLNVNDNKGFLTKLDKIQYDNKTKTNNIDNPTQILDWLYIGSNQNALDKSLLKSLNIKSILNCASECNNNYDKDFNYKHLKLIDSTNYPIIDHINSAIQFLEEAKSSNSIVLVHCKMGISRSVTIVIAFIMKLYHYTPQQAFRYIKSKREQAQPNLGFMDQLHLYEASLKE